MHDPREGHMDAVY
jgi:hypothetical protein